MDVMRKTRTRIWAPAGFMALLLLDACGGGGTANVAPTASAGSAQSLYSGDTVTLNGTGSRDSDGSVASYAWTQTGGPAVVLTGPTTPQPSFVAPPVSSVSTFTFSLVVTDNKGAVSPAATVTITVSGSRVVAGLVRFARVGYQSVAPFGLDYANPVLRPARGVIVRALDAGSQAVLATTATDASGNYSLSVTANTNITIQVVAQMQRNGAQPLPHWDMRVQNGITGNAPYSYASAAFNSNAGTKNVDIPTGIPANGSAPAQVTDRASGPFAILDTLYTATQKVITAATAADFPELIVDWGVQTVGTHFLAPSNGTQYIRLLSSLTEDPDEFDQHTIAHEFGHYIEQNFSRADNIGGSHALGDRLDMRVAFGEGFGYAFAAMVLDDPLVRDAFVNNGVQVSGSFNVENNPTTTGCWCSETSVASLLWDLYDQPPDGSDNISLPFSALWDVITVPQRVTLANTSVFSFIKGLKDLQPGFAAQINALVAAQNINSATIDAFASTETNAPYPAMLPLYANITKGGGPVTVRSIDDGGHYNKAGNISFLRFIPSTTGPVTVSVTTSNTAVTRDPDFFVWDSGAFVSAGVNGAAEYPETETFNVTAGKTYVIEAYDCANGCSTVSGTPGDYNITVTIN
jgi:hypothetical protein